jgi:hypothetical protein
VTPPSPRKTDLRRSTVAESASQTEKIKKIQKSGVMKLQKPGEKMLSNFQSKLTGYLDFIFTINLSNYLIIPQPPKEGFLLYRAVITKANNGMVVKACLK